MAVERVSIDSDGWITRIHHFGHVKGGDGSPLVLTEYISPRARIDMYVKAGLVAVGEATLLKRVLCGESFHPDSAFGRIIGNVRERFSSTAEDNGHKNGKLPGNRVG